MKTVIKLLIAAVVLHGAFRIGAAYWALYQYEDELQQIAQFAGNRQAKEVRDQALTKATEMALPITSEAIQVRRSDREIFIDVAYVDQVQIFPTYYRPWEFKASVKAWTRAW